MACMHMAVLQALSILFLASMPMLVAGSAEEEAPAGYRFDLTHVTDNSGSSVKYLMGLKMGTKQKTTTFLGVVDTGSELVWTYKMKMCTDSPSFTATSEPCSKYCKNKHCNSCILNRTYASGKTGMKGFVGNEVLTLPTGTDKKVALVCAIEWSDGMLPASTQEIVAEGIVGLSRGPLSLVKKLKVTSFSYCLSNPFVKPKLTSPLWFGREEKEAGWRSTPLVEIISPEPRHSQESASASANRYYVELDEICIQGSCRQLEKDDFEFKGENKGLMFVDSGCTYTHLDSKIFAALKELLEQALEETKTVAQGAEDKVVHNLVHNPGTGVDCFEEPFPPSRPDMTLKFTEADLHLPWADYVDEEFCLKIWDSDKSILGNMQQQNLHMLYDLTEGKEKLSFKRVDDCSQL